MSGESRAELDATTLGRPLAEREVQILGLVALGLTDDAIGRRLYLSGNTIKTHLRHAYAKLGATSRTGAVETARRRGELPLMPGTVAARELLDLAREWEGRAPDLLIARLRELGRRR